MTQNFSATFNDDETDSIVFAILERAKATEVVKSRWDLDNFPKPKEYPGFPKEKFVLLTDSGEFSEKLVQYESLIETLNKAGQGLPGYPAGPIIESVILSDVAIEQPTKIEDLKAEKKLTIVCKLPSSLSAVDEFQTSLHQFVVDLIDIIGLHGKLSADGKLKSRRIRQAAEDKILKAQEAIIKKASCFNLGISRQEDC